jgi:hypothetical protein
VTEEKEKTWKQKSKPCFLAIRTNENNYAIVYKKIMDKNNKQTLEAQKSVNNYDLLLCSTAGVSCCI